MHTLLLAEHNHVALSEATAKCLGAAQALAGNLGGEIDILVVGDGEALQKISEAARHLTGVRRVLVAAGAPYEGQLAEPVADLLVRLAPDYTTLMAAASTTGKNIMPRAAALLDRAQVSEITAVLTADTFERPIYAGNAIQTVQCAQDKKCLTVRPSAFCAADTSQTPAPVEHLEPAEPSQICRYVGEELTKSDRPELTDARVIISGGRGMKDAQNFALLEKIADQLGAALGASRAAVDSGFISNDHQVGQTGKVVAPDLYIAVGISGAIQHLAGMKESKVIVAINKDPDAPIFQIADYGWVADLFKALPELEAELSKAGF